MKKAIYIILAFICLVSGTSCSKFLDSFPPYAVDPSISVTDSVAIAMTNGCYIPLQSSNLYNMRLWSLDIIAGNSELGGEGGSDGIETVQIKEFNASADNAFALYVWRSPWVGIGQCNLVIQSVENSTTVSTEIRNRSLGEAYFLRAHYYYILVRLFGGVPLRLEPYDTSESTDIAREDLATCYDRIIKDCQTAISLLEPKSTYGVSDKNRVGKEAALAMLADIYLTWQPQQHYEEVVSLCNQIADLGYDLTKCKFEDNFGVAADNSPEALFTVGYSGRTDSDFWSGSNQASWLSCYMGPRGSNMVAGGWGWNLPTEEFMSQWEDGDLRKRHTVLYKNCPSFDGIMYQESWSATGYNVRKFLVTKADSPEYNTSPADFVVYRYADVLLKKAEALNELNRTDEACEPLNIVRTRAGLTPVQKGELDQDEMREKIIHERRMELAFEGHRWFDMIRINDGQYAIDFLKSIGQKPTKDRLLLPIPQTEMDANDLMEQNKGY